MSHSQDLTGILSRDANDPTVHHFPSSPTTLTKEQVVIGQMVRTVVARWDTSAGTIGRVDTVGCTFDRPYADLNSVSTKAGAAQPDPFVSIRRRLVRAEPKDHWRVFSWRVIYETLMRNAC
jgi:hypothetical protein